MTLRLTTWTLLIPAMLALTGCLPDVPDRTILYRGKAYVFPFGDATTWTADGRAAGDISFVGQDPDDRLPFYDLAVAHDQVTSSSRDLGGGRLVECPSDGYLRGCEMALTVDGVRWSLKLSGGGRRADTLDAGEYDQASQLATWMIRDAERRGRSMPRDEIVKLEHGIVHGCDLGPC